VFSRLDLHASLTKAQDCGNLDCQRYTRRPSLWGFSQLEPVPRARRLRTRRPIYQARNSEDALASFVRSLARSNEHGVVLFLSLRNHVCSRFLRTIVARFLHKRPENHCIVRQNRDNDLRASRIHRTRSCGCGEEGPTVFAGGQMLYGGRVVFRGMRSESAYMHGSSSK
jgi:hypothetical protein